MRKDFRYVVFDDQFVARKFKEVYGGIVEDTRIYSFYNQYFGNKINGKFLVTIRESKENFDEIVRALGLTRKVWNGRQVYVY